MTKSRIYFSISGDFSSVPLVNRDEVIMTAMVTPLQQERLQELLYEYNDTKHGQKYNPDVLDSLISLITRIGAKKI